MFISHKFPNDYSIGSEVDNTINNDDCHTYCNETTIIYLKNKMFTLVVQQFIGKFKRFMLYV